MYIYIHLWYIQIYTDVTGITIFMCPFVLLAANSSVCYRVDVCFSVDVYLCGYHIDIEVHIFMLPYPTSLHSSHNDVIHV